MRLLADESGPVKVWFTDREGGVGLAPYESLNLAARVGDDPGVVDVNRKRVADAAGFDLSALALARQVHGADCIEVTPGMSGVVGEADVLVTRTPGVVIGILTADCAPVIVAGNDAIAVAHAGWRGLVAGAIERAVEEVGDVLQAWIGPAIRACCYEVGPEVVDAFVGAGLPVEGSRCVDPVLASIAALNRAGIEDVSAAEACTMSDPRYFSHRRDGVTGRQGAFASIVP
ncbi:MAG: purine-nucleoside/S-methyl-5-thioadenosine phosphorylase / adenosine deaminase [Actinomycetota bacterium]|nr:purine-nucleoside/S-methyl-5-thioadenosine phosphorylase / adenosine deaminase [Actinomycetota bacterium]